MNKIQLQHGMYLFWLLSQALKPKMHRLHLDYIQIQIRSHPNHP